jgi:hypothetical protein
MREKDEKRRKLNYCLDLFTAVTWQEFKAAGMRKLPLKYTP